MTGGSKALIQLAHQRQTTVGRNASSLWAIAKREDGDVVFLAEGLRGLGDSFGRLGGDGRGAVKAEEFAGGLVASFDDAVRDERERASRVEQKLALFVVN